MKILALESSTSSAKALLYDGKTGAVEVSTKSYAPMYKNPDVHDMEAVCAQMLAVGRELLGGRTDVDMIALGSTWHSVSLCDRNMAPHLPALPWCYTGASDLCRELRANQEYVERYYWKTGCMVNAIYPFFKLMMLKRMGYNLKNYRIAGQGVYNTFRLTGEYAATQCLASGTGLLNIHNKKYDPDALRELDIDETVLPRLIPYNETYPLTDASARELGLPSGILVVPSNSDGGLNQIGVGAMEKGIMTFSVGTSGAIRLTTNKPVLPENQGTWCYLSPKSWLSGAATSGACNCVDWFKERFAKGLTYEELEQRFTARQDLPVFLPFIYGERCPGWNDDRKGAFDNLGSLQSVQDLYYSVQEGILFNLYQCYETLTEVHGEPRRIKLSGGILNSRRWTQMCADIFGKEMEIDIQAQSSLMGAVALAMDIAGEEAPVLNVAPASIVRPDPQREVFYTKRYEQYLEFYKRH